MNSRRKVVIALAGSGFAASNRAFSQQRVRKLPKVGILWHAANAQEEMPYFGGLMEGFKKLGYVEGENIHLEHRFPNEVPEKFASMAADLVAEKVDVLVGVGANSSQYVKNATTMIPVIFMYVPDPVRSKLVESLGRPGGNTTGLTNSAAELTGIRIQFVKETVPGLSRLAFFVNPNAQISGVYVAEAQAAAANLGLNMQVFEARTLDELDRAFDARVKARIQALVINSEGLFFVGRSKIANLAIANRLPLCTWSRETLEAGALMSYGPDQVAIARGVAGIVDKILKGAKPADIPVEQPTKFEFLVNGKTAKALGVKIPQSLLLRADAVIE